ncbi:MAG: Methyltransferase domain [Blastocatellia bacterium]|jgi:predicted RNA methylase|nr:Methyltransferase domain [Blastocatellia bacterium]
MEFDPTLLNEPSLRALLAHLNRWSTKGKKLSYGFLAPLTTSQQIAATKLNSIYSKVLWGICNDADNRSIRQDEKELLTGYLKESVWGSEVIEVGTGSGRLTGYASTVCKQLVAIDRDPTVVARLKSRSFIKKRKNIKIVCADLIQLKQEDQYSALLLMENLIGMYLKETCRRQILQKALEVIRPGGLAFISFRVVEQSSPLSFQAMPYDAKLPSGERIHLFGVVVNWTVAAFMKELDKVSREVHLIDLHEGGKRPAGGTMFTAILKKQI